MTMLDWAVAPAPDELINAMKHKRGLSEELASKKLDFKIMQADAKASSRAAYAAVIGAEPADRTAFIQIQRDILVLEAQVAIAQDEIDMVKRRLDMHKAWQFANR